MKVAFLDRDGLINEDIGYLHEWQYFKYNDLVIPALLNLMNANYKLIVVTNQSGIARGYYTESDFNILNSKMIESLKNHGVYLWDVFYCPHYVGGKVKKYSVNCSCRKPKPGLLIKAQEKYQIDLANSVLFGDRYSDLEAGKAAGISNNYLVNRNVKFTPDKRVFKNLLSATDHFLLSVSS